jgi:ABC-type polysaccharide/polyol phosphate export permease
MQEIDLPQTAPGYRELESPTVKVMRPVKRRIRLGDIVREAEVIRVVAARDFKVKYKQSLLGPIWLVFQPLALLAAFLVAFRHLAHVQSGTPYIVFALIGLSVWSFFQASMTIGSASLISSGTLVRFTRCPRFAFPIAGVIASLPVFGITSVASLAAAAISGALSVKVLLLPLALAWLFLLTAGGVGITASLAVRYRDVISAMPFLLQVGVFLAPVGYPLHSLGGTVRTLVELNPLTGLIELSRWMVVSGYHISPRTVIYSLVVTVIVAVVGWRIFSRLETTMADEI